VPAAISMRTAPFSSRQREDTSLALDPFDPLVLADDLETREREEEQRTPFPLFDLFRRGSHSVSGLRKGHGRPPSLRGGGPHGRNPGQRSPSQDQDLSPTFTFFPQMHIPQKIEADPYTLHVGAGNG